MDLQREEYLSTGSQDVGFRETVGVMEETMILAESGAEWVGVPHGWRAPS
jgi:hypothetical protein